MKKCFFASILILVGLIFSQGVFAQGVNIGVSPLSFELTANPGDVIVNQLKVYNSSEDSVVIKMEIEDIVPAGERGEVKSLPVERETYSLASWVTVEPAEFTLEPKEQKYVAFQISVPGNAEPGGHYGTVLARTTAVGASAGGAGVTIATRTGVLVLLSVSGDIREELVVRDFTAPTYSESGPISFAVRFENKGTIHVRPMAVVTITDFMGKKVTELQLSQNNVLPESIRRFDISWDKKWLFGGRYVATLSGSYGVGGTLLSPQVITFWVFPWKVGLGILAVLLLLILTRRRWLAAFKVLLRGERRSGKVENKD
jgi:hypothetical protein